MGTSAQPDRPGMCRPRVGRHECRDTTGRAAPPNAANSHQTRRFRPRQIPFGGYLANTPSMTIHPLYSGHVVAAAADSCPPSYACYHSYASNRRNGPTRADRSRLTAEGHLLFDRPPACPVSALGPVTKVPISRSRRKTPAHPGKHLEDPHPPLPEKLRILIILIILTNNYPPARRTSTIQAGVWPRNSRSSRALEK
jgi:hypothetical protein